MDKFKRKVSLSLLLSFFWGSAYSSGIPHAITTQLTHPFSKEAAQQSSFVGEDQWCKEVSQAYHDLKWEGNPCLGIKWIKGGTSIQGRPLVYAEFGDPHAKNVTLILSTVHGDEVTPLYIGIQLVHWLKERQEQLLKSNLKVVVAPLVNPDGFFGHPRTRMNANGVDINRNFATQDWHSKALVAWRTKYKSEPRRFPGKEPRSEPETIFQEELIKKARPQKILSIHSPLNFLDYDGPTKVTLSRFPTDYAQECEKLKRRLKAISSGYFPGSLGNYAGRELGIPTLTLELPSADPRRARRYWNQFSNGIQTMIHFTVPPYVSESLSASTGG